MAAATAMAVPFRRVVEQTEESLSDGKWPTKKTVCSHSEADLAPRTQRGMVFHTKVWILLANGVIHETADKTRATAGISQKQQKVLIRGVAQDEILLIQEILSG